MSSSITALSKIRFATRNDMGRDSCTRQEEQSYENDSPHLCRLVNNNNNNENVMNI